MVSIEDDLCGNCGERFQEHPEVRAKKLGMHAEIKRNAGKVFSIVTIAISLALLTITLMLDNLHRWIMPIEQNWFTYLIPMSVGVIAALGIIIWNMKTRAIFKESSSARIIMPYALLTISCIGMTLILFAGEVDRFLSVSASILLPALAASCILGFILLAISKSASHKNKRRDSWVERS